MWGWISILHGRQPLQAGLRAGIFDCKPLPILWAKFAEYTPENTIMYEFFYLFEVNVDCFMPA